MSKYILVVDDEDDVREILDLILGTLEIPIQHVIDGKAAVETITQQLPLVMILDLEMPKYDGQYVINYLREQEIDVPIIVFTSHTITPELSNRLDIPEARMFQKGSVSMTVLRQQVINIVRKDIDIDLSLL